MAIGSRLIVRGREVVLWRRLLPALFICAVLLVPAFESNLFLLRVLTLAWLAAMLTIGNSLSLGYGGLFNLSQASFYGVGAYTTAILVTQYHVPFEFATLSAVILAAAAGGLLGLIAVRVRGDYWSLVSLAFTVGMFQVFQNWIPVTGGENGYFGIPEITAFGIPLNSSVSYYYATAITLIVIYLLTSRFTRTFAGRAMLAVRYDEAAASTTGISPGYFRVLSMIIAAAIAGVAGALLVAVTRFIDPSPFDIVPSFNIMFFSIVGGVTSLFGGIIATVGFTYIVEEYRDLAQYELLIYGGSLLVAIFLRTGIWRDIARSLSRRARAAVVNYLRG